MKPGELRRKTRLVAKTPLQAKTGLKSGGFLKRGSFIPQPAIKAKRPKMTSEERAARKLVRTRSGSVCEICGVAPMTEFQHRLAKAHGGPWTASNGIAVCGHGNVSGCHGAIHQRPTGAVQQGWTIKSSDRRDPANVPVWLFALGVVFLNADGSVTEVEDEDAA